MKRYIAVIVAIAMSLGASAQMLSPDLLTRYVADSVYVDSHWVKGSYANDGLSWNQPKAKIQDAINDLREYMVSQNITSGGRIFVAEGIYTPTESTEETGGTTLNLSIKVYSGMTLYGGFNKNAPESDPANRLILNIDGTDAGAIGTNRHGLVRMKHETILSGNLNTNRTASFSWSDSRQTYTTVMPGNTYHVVTFATNGANTVTHRFNALLSASAIDGFTIQHGNAGHNDAITRHHTSYGGGVYMVDGATVRYCEIRQCSAARNGGAVYCDNGGEIRNSYIHTSQATGIGIEYGEGGGVMIDGKGSIQNCAIVGCYGRTGAAVGMTDGGMGSGGRYNYQATVSASLIANNTAASEAGAIYMRSGGVLNNVSIYRNRCNGVGTVIGGQANGQAASVFAGPMSRIYNTAIWGGSLGTAGDGRADIEYATSAGEGDERPQLIYVSLTHHDIADWTYTYKKDVQNLAEENIGVSTGHNYIALTNPTSQSGVITPSHAGWDYLNTCNYTPHFYSAIAAAGIQLSDIPVEAAANVSRAYATHDLLGQEYAPKCDLGAYIADEEHVVHTETVKWVENPDFTGTVYTLFVDPSRQIASSQDAGDSWDRPLNNVRMALAYFQQWKDKHDSRWTPETAHYQILVKQGTLYTPLPGRAGATRGSSIWMTEHVGIYGGYASPLTATNVDKRDPILYPTVLSGNVSNSGYEYNSAHLIVFGNVTDATLDGFQLTLANAASGKQIEAVENRGAGIYVRNDKELRENTDGTYGILSPTVRKDMVNTIRNCMISNCGAAEGAGLYMSAEAGTTTTLHVVNTIFHNNGVNFNAAGEKVTTPLNRDGSAGAVVYVGANAVLDMDHCDLLRNVGHGIVSGETSANVRVSNTIFYANLDREVTETNNFARDHRAYIMAPIHKRGGKGTWTNNGKGHNLYDNTGEYTPYNTWTDNTGLSTESERVLTYYFQPVNTPTTYPRFTNPTSNAGISTTGSITYYGSTPDFTPTNLNPMVNAGSFAGEHSTWGFDMRGTLRDWGGLPDIGAIENFTNAEKYHDYQPAYGEVMYVRDYRNGDGTIDPDITDRDGTSWSRAINGNGLYQETAKSNMKLVVPEASTNTTTPEHIYYIAMLQNNTATGAHYFAYNDARPAGGNWTIKGKTNGVSADQFVLLNAGGGKYYIYDLTRKKYVYYTETIEGAEKVCLKDGTDGNTTWYLHSVSTADNMRTYTIIPGELADNINSLAWNYFGGVSNKLGLYAGTDNGSKWQFYINETNLQINGLQHAVNVQAINYENDTDPNKKNREVWVAAGVYAKDNEKGYTDHFDNRDNTSLNADESCFIIRDGVDVYGAFSAKGNPCMNERQPLLSQYVNNLSDYETKDYETIIEPLTPLSGSTMLETRRVLGPPYKYNPTNNPAKNYHGAKWDGFTIRNGYMNSNAIQKANQNGAAGATIYYNVTLKNCVVTLNSNLSTGTSQLEFRGGGILARGGTIEECYVINNRMVDVIRNGEEVNETDTRNGVAYGGGIYIRNNATIFNTVIANNHNRAKYADGAGLFIDGEVNCFNNTIVNNRAFGRSRAAAGVAVWTSGSTSQLIIYNTIIANNVNPTTKDVEFGNPNVSIPQKGVIHLYNCLSETINDYPGTNDRKILFHDCQAAPVPSALFENLGNYETDFKLLNLRLNPRAVGAINTGNDAPVIGGITYDLSHYTDMDYTERIQDCRIDIGAYEYNGAQDIVPDIESEAGSAIYYVSWDGHNASSATDPNNSACHEKLQKVLDAAGRYKYVYPATRVIVKIARDDNDANRYYPERSVDPDVDDARLWSIIVPRGVELWGGYKDQYVSSEDDNLTYTDTQRDIMGYPTCLTGYYQAEGTTTQGYHVVHFTDLVFDPNGNAYAATDAALVATGGKSTYNGTNGQLSLSTRTNDRAVVDGLHISNGMADAAVSGGIGVNEKRYGGACVIPAFGHVRNCILTDNTAAEGGGAVYIRQGGVLSGSLLKNNRADYGGAIYVEQLSQDIADYQYPEEMAQIVTSTIVDNKANIAGGGLWFYNNTRVNSSVLWKNQCDDQADVSGQTSSAYRGAIDESSVYLRYPFAYSAVMNVRLAGTNNISVASESNRGVRFIDESQTEPARIRQHYYALDDYSVLNNAGMPNTTFLTDFVAAYGVSEQDFSFLGRISGDANFVDIGARSNEASSTIVPTSPEQLLLRLYVAQAEDVDYERMNALRTSDDAIYSKIGSSFAYPMQHLDDALQYIRNARLDETEIAGTDDGTGTPYRMKHYAANLPFEIVVSRGTFYPQLDIQGNYGYSNANTFLLPEGVTLVGGMACDTFQISDHGKTIHCFYGQSRKAKAKTHTYGNVLIDNTDLLTDVEVLESRDTEIEGGGEMLSPARRAAGDGSGIYDEGSTMVGYRMTAWPIDSLLNRRAHADHNANGIYEPWEFANQTILSGKIVNSKSTGSNRAYHVLSVIADELRIGERPMVKTVGSQAEYTLGTINPSYNSSAVGTVEHETGQRIYIDGVEIQDGSAMAYQATTISGNASYSYYHGGGLVVDGNRYSEGLPVEEGGTGIVSAYKHAGAPNAIAYRNIPVVIKNCVFSGNRGGYGGAISSNATLSVFSSHFYQNEAISGEDDNVLYTDLDGINHNDGVCQYPGVGGCIYVTKELSLLNTLMDNNETSDPTGNGALRKYRSLRNSISGGTGAAIYGGAGACIFGGRNSVLNIMNCDFVRNRATLFPAIYTMNPNTQDASGNIVGRTAPRNKAQNGNYNEIFNTIFWGNRATSGKGYASEVINHARVGSYTSSPTQSTTGQDFPNALPVSQMELNSFAPTLWFCAYEQGTAIDASYRYDLRNAGYDIVAQDQYVPLQLKKYATTPVAEGGAGIPVDEYIDQNCNIHLNATNSELDGPNFASPSVTAGKDGYMPSADWSLSRANNLVDNGWGRLEQDIEQIGGGESGGVTEEDVTYSVRFRKQDAAPYRYIGSGAYYTAHYIKANRLDRSKLVYIGDSVPENVYMYYSTTGLESTADSQDKYMFRISHDPNPSHDQTYIDMGVYEYVHTKLRPTEENQVDILWVSDQENLVNGDPDGSCWEQPTSDLQRAIETLLASRNGHDKEIRILNGEYTPIYTMGDEKLLTFYISTGKLNTEAEVLHGTTQAQQTVKSLTISGGWAKDWKMTDRSERDIETYPAVIRSAGRSGVANDKLDNVFRIEDARQWYGVTERGTTGAATASLYPAPGSEKVPNVIPITIDGIRLVNSNATAGNATSHQAGAAFYYGDQTYEDPNTHTTKYCDKPDDGAMKLKINHAIVMNSGYRDAATVEQMGSAMFIGRGGERALVYNTVFHSNYGDPLYGYNMQAVNCTFAQNRGMVRLFDYDPTHISDPGFWNTSCMHNSILWRNNLLAVPAGNGDQIVFTPDIKETHQDKFIPHKTENYGAGTWAQAAYDANYFTYNALSSAAYYATEGQSEEASRDNKMNVGISLTNEDPVFGPNFQSVLLSAITQADQEQRDYHLLPSVRLMNKGDNNLYESHVGVPPTQTYDKTIETLKDGHPDDPTQWQTRITTVYHAWDADGSKRTDSTTVEARAFDIHNDKDGTFTYYGVESDAGNNERVSAVTIDMGAYEYDKALSRVIYVDPSGGDGSGMDWGDTYNDLQRAIDLVSVYNSYYGHDAFVFTRVGRINTRLMMRDGVHVYGSVGKTYTATSLRNEQILTHPQKVNDPSSQAQLKADWDNDDALINAYIEKVQQERDGMANPTTELTRTTINGVTNANAAYASVSLLDGFDIHAGSSEGIVPVVTEPVVDIQNVSGGKFILRNCIVRDNRSESSDIVRLSSPTLFYNVLLRDNETTGADKAVLNLNHADACAVHISIHTRGEKTVVGTGSLYNSLTWSVATNTIGRTLGTDAAFCNNTGTEGAPFTEYLARQTGYSVYPNILYQLSENSVHIERCNKPEHLPATGTRQGVFDSYIDFSKDRDVLGNPRLLTGNSKTDRGCFETWRIGTEYLYKDASLVTDAQRKTQIAEAPSVTLTINPGARTYTYKRRYFPHPGSVVYIMPGSNLVLGADNDDSNTLRNYSVDGYTFRPAYLLVKEGGSLYGHGNHVSLPYLSVEKYYDRPLTAGSALHRNGLTALPFDFDYSDAQTVDYAETTQIPDLADDSNVPLYRYDAAGRSLYDNVFSPTDSRHWGSALEGTDRRFKANQGVLFRPSLTEGDSVLYRFSAINPIYGNTLDDVYREEPEEESKIIILTQHDDYESTGGGADFTSKEDMGWNCIGLPYLQGNYLTGAISSGTPLPYRMHVPHELWLYHNDNNGYERCNSWEDEVYLMTGEGVFTQTAALADENLHFVRPEYVAPGSSVAPRQMQQDVLPSGSAMAHFLPGLRLGGSQPEPTPLPSEYTVYSYNGRLYIRGLEGGEHILLYDAAGHLCYQTSDHGSSIEHELGGGLYLVRIDDAGYKVMGRD